MKTTLKILVCFAILICMSACAMDSKESIPLENNNGEIIILPTGNFWKQDSKDDFIAENPGKYLEFDIQTDFCASVDAHKLDPLGAAVITSFNGISENCISATRSLPEANYYSVQVKGIKLGEKQTTTRSASQNGLQTIFGKKTDFIISRNPMTTRSGVSHEASQDSTVSMYVPKMIEILSPAIKNEDDLYPLCYYKEMELRWNADENNPNGIMVVVEWTGTMIFGEDNPDVYIRRTDVINEDSGSIVLKDEMFKDIPDTALVYITLLRGNVENFLVDDYSYKLMAESHQILPIILIRNLRNK
ncbi:hypothetical protein [uncultured Bacteroides sp.]|uniref:hypothetical protein n=1 Tax=uncultured Bacteroides sp. TaxID=162156 RepID=UPI00262122EC|nr:hypothetical protein [uncultured Bacteroides sp.]